MKKNAARLIKAVVCMFFILTVSESAFAYGEVEFNRDERNVAVAQIVCALMDGQTSNLVICDRGVLAYDSMEFIENAVKKICYPHYNNVVIVNDRETKTAYVDMSLSLYYYKVNKRVEKMANTICKKVSKKTGKKNKVKKINDRLCAKMKPYQNIDENNILEKLNSWRGNCVCYAMVFKACCDKMHIKCRSICGYVYYNAPHMWSQVKIGGKWYYVDSAMNDGGNRQKYLLSRKLWATYKIDGIGY